MAPVRRVRGQLVVRMFGSDVLEGVTPSRASASSTALVAVAPSVVKRSSLREMHDAQAVTGWEIIGVDRLRPRRGRSIRRRTPRSRTGACSRSGPVSASGLTSMHVEVVAAPHATAGRAARVAADHRRAAIAVGVSIWALPVLRPGAGPVRPSTSPSSVATVRRRRLARLEQESDPAAVRRLDDPLRDRGTDRRTRQRPPDRSAIIAASQDLLLLAWGVAIANVCRTPEALGRDPQGLGLERDARGVDRDRRRRDGHRRPLGAGDRRWARVAGLRQPESGRCVLRRVRSS